MATVKLIDFWAPWCGPCKVMDPILDEIKKEHEGKFDFEAVNVDEKPEMASKYGVMGIPTYVVEKDGKEVGRKIGITPKSELIKLITA